MTELSRQDINTQQPFHPSNPFADLPNYPPPAYNFHVRDPEAGLPPCFQSQHNYPLNEPITPLKSVATSSTLFKSTSVPRNAAAIRYHNQKKYNRRRMLCFCFATMVIILIPLLVLGTVFQWGRGNQFCVKWSDGTTSGDCS
ncbi:hypothetical protein VTL71DRAFT_7634 [Oculimacula yallundae]|uniref:Uncharacterized protein n=1 Tax=Oculimacula yallundae TaxID=86028 RepID=A0ABR4BUS2_9HELO